MNLTIFILFIYFVEKSFSQDTPSYLVVDNCNQYKSCESCVANFIEFNNFCYWCDSDSSCNNITLRSYTSGYSAASFLFSNVVCRYPRLGSNTDLSCKITNQNEYKNLIQNISDSLTGFLFIMIPALSFLCFFSYQWLFKGNPFWGFFGGLFCPGCHWCIKSR